MRIFHNLKFCYVSRLRVMPSGGSTCPNWPILCRVCHYSINAPPLFSLSQRHLGNASGTFNTLKGKILSLTFIVFYSSKSNRTAKLPATAYQGHPFDTTQHFPPSPADSSAGSQSLQQHPFLTRMQLSVEAPHACLLLTPFTFPLSAGQTASPQPGKEQPGCVTVSPGDWAPNTAVWPSVLKTEHARWPCDHQFWRLNTQHGRLSVSSGDSAPEQLSHEISYGITQCGAGITCVKGSLSNLSAWC